MTRRPIPWGWFAAVAVVIVVWVAAAALRGGGTKELMSGWADGLEAGQAQAQAQDKPMLLFFTAGWCGPCQQFKRTVLKQDAAHEALFATAIPVQVDLTDRSANNPNLSTAEQYGVRGIPTVLFANSDGKAIEQYQGPNDPDAFVAWLHRLSPP